MTIPFAEVDAGYRLFLARSPNMENPPSFANVPQLIDTLFRSVEFRHSPQARKYGYPWPTGQIFVCKPAKVIYCPIGKNACTFFKRQMVRMAGVPQEAFLLRDVHFLTDWVNTGFELNDYPPDEVTALMADPAYFRFAVLRDPAERLLSAYLEKFVLARMSPGNIRHTHAVVQAAQGQHPDFDRGISFRQFVEQVISTPPNQLDPHWIPQSLYLAGASWNLFGFDQINTLISVLEERSGRSLPRQADNYLGSGKGEIAEGALDLLPETLVGMTRIDRQSFWTDTLQESVRQYFADDYSLLSKIGATS